MSFTTSFLGAELMPRAQRIGFVLVMSLSIGMLPRFAHPVSAQVASIEAPHIGEGGFPQFQVDPDFPKLPSKWRMGFGSAVAIDDKAHVWILIRTSALEPTR